MTKNIKIVRNEKSGFVWYECNFDAFCLLHFDLRTLVNDLFIYTGIDYSSNFFNNSLN